MKLTTLATITGLALAATAQAGEEASAKQVIAPIAALCDWSWFAGGSVGVIDGDDWDEDIYTLHIGKERKCAGSKSSHAFFLEVGYTEDDESSRTVVNTPGEQIIDTSEFLPDTQEITQLRLETEIIPITLNYKYESVFSGNFNWYAGAGAGIALVDMDLKETTTTIQGDSNTSVVDNQSDDDAVFYAHIFAGLVYNVSDSWEVFGGARYIFMDDPDFGGDSVESPLDEEVQYELGARYNF